MSAARLQFSWISARYFVCLFVFTFSRMDAAIADLAVLVRPLFPATARVDCIARLLADHFCRPLCHTSFMTSLLFFERCAGSGTTVVQHSRWGCPPRPLHTRRQSDHFACPAACTDLNVKGRCTTLLGFYEAFLDQGTSRAVKAFWRRLRLHSPH